MPKVRKIPQRQCVACGQMRGKRDLVRVVRTPAGEVRVDRTGKLSGRGAYVCPEAACVERALREGRLEGALERAISEDVARSLHEALTRPAPTRGPVVRRITLAQMKESQAAQSSNGRDRREGA
jgi:predicted RNA-binding protein YlxR (DUF448 family)